MIVSLDLRVWKPRRWEVARVVAYEELVLSIKTIDRYLEIPESVQHSVQTSIKSLTLIVTETYLETPMITGRLSEDEIRSLLVVSQDVGSAQEWWDHRKESLHRIAPQLKQMSRMTSFNLINYVYLELSLVQDSVYLVPILSLLSNMPESLFSLTVDNCGTPSSRPPGPQECNHMCPSLLSKSFTPHLRHLCIRSRNICPEILEVISSGSYNGLKSLIISLTLRPEELPWMSKVSYSHFCLGFHEKSTDLNSSLVDAAKAVLPRLPRLKTLKIVRQRFPAEDLLSFDVIHNHQITVSLGIDWKAIDHLNVDHLNADDDGYSSESSEWSQDSSFSMDSIEETA